MRAFLPGYRYLPTEGNRKLNQQLKRAHGVLFTTIEERRTRIRERVEGEASCPRRTVPVSAPFLTALPAAAGLRGVPGDMEREDEGAELLDLLLLANEEGEEKMSSQQLRDEAMTFLFAGYAGSWRRGRDTASPRPGTRPPHSS